MKEHLGEFYDKTSDFQQEQYLTLCKIVEKTIPDRSSIRTLLDIGAGSGARTKQMLELFPNIERLIAIEPDVDMIDVARKNYADSRIEYELMPAADVGKLAEKNIIFDAVVCNWAMHWIPNKPQLFEELDKLIHIDSYFIFSTCEALPGLLSFIDGYIRNEFGLTAQASPFHYLNAIEWRDFLLGKGWQMAALEAFPLTHHVESAQNYLDHWFTASAAKFMYGKHIYELSQLSHSGLLLMMQHSYPSAAYPEGLAFREDVLFGIAKKN